MLNTIQPNENPPKKQTIINTYKNTPTKAHHHQQKDDRTAQTCEISSNKMCENMKTTPIIKQNVKHHQKHNKSPKQATLNKTRRQHITTCKQQKHQTQ